MARTLNTSEARARFRSAVSGAGRRSAFSTVSEAKAAFRKAAARPAAGGLWRLFRRTELLDSVMLAVAVRVLTRIRRR